MDNGEKLKTKAAGANNLCAKIAHKFLGAVAMVCVTLAAEINIFTEAVENEEKIKVFPKPFPNLSTAFTQSLGIKPLLKLVDILLNGSVIAEFFFNFFNGVYGGSMVFAAKLMGNFGKTQVELTS